MGIRSCSREGGFMGNLTNHARERFQSRGFFRELLDFFLNFGEDRFVKGALEIRVTKRLFKKLLNDKSICESVKKFMRQHEKQITNKALIDIDGIIVTCMNITERRYL